ncbi:hypothetical protein L3X38_002949 [Prunus dulcis]|uniref:Uncharacterized protein n=1 Tax=Prunus dulcis TaxID=3755 RepID=A0AAD4WUX7_PRUDU|nr:hypothetical protein L3X38_002949 [Prunus dulcis]
MKESEIEVILIKSSDDKSMEEINGEVVQKELRDVQMNKDYQGVKSTRVSDSFGVNMVKSLSFPTAPPPMSNGRHTRPNSSLSLPFGRALSHASPNHNLSAT